MKPKLFFPVVLCLFFAFFLTQPAYAADPVTIVPSGDTTGQTDADALQAALVDAAPGTVIQLAAGTYYLNHVLLAENFHGTIQGAGREKTIITTVGESKTWLMCCTISRPMPLPWASIRNASAYGRRRAIHRRQSWP